MGLANHRHPKLTAQKHGTALILSRACRLPTQFCPHFCPSLFRQKEHLAFSQLLRGTEHRLFALQLSAVDKHISGESGLFLTHTASHRLYLPSLSLFSGSSRLPDLPSPPAWLFLLFFICPSFSLVTFLCPVAHTFFC